MSLTELVRTALGLQADFEVVQIRDADSLPKRRQPQHFITTFATTGVSSVSWNPQIFQTGYAVPAGCDVLANAVLSSHEREEAVIELINAGWWCFYGDGEHNRVFLLPRPQVKMKSGRVHCETGPAVIWPDADAVHEYYLEGCRVPKDAIEWPHKLPDLAISHENAEVRRVLANLYGHERLMKECGKAVQEDEFGRLWAINSRPAPDGGLLVIGNGLRMVEVINSTPEPDGTLRRYMLRVPPTMKTAKEAVAWTFNMTERQYQPAVQT